VICFGPTGGSTTRHRQFDRGEFNHALDHLIALIGQAKACVKIVRELGGFLGENPAINNFAPVFWSASGSALAVVAQLWAFKLFDPDSKLTVPCILVQASGLRTQFGHATPEQVDTIVKLANCKIAAMPTDSRTQIRSKRHKVIAHLDQRLVTDPSKIAPDLKVTWSDILTELQIGSSIVTELSLAFRGSTPSYDLPGTDDYKRVLEAAMYFLDNKHDEL
jgi:hypothetical protein